MDRNTTSMLLCLGLGFLAACASAPPPKVESGWQADTEPRASSQAGDESEVATTSSGDDDKTSAASNRTQAESSTTPSERESEGAMSALRHEATAIDLMTASGTAYIIDYAHSGAIEGADSTCSEKAAKAEESARAALAAKVAKAIRATKASSVAKVANVASAAKIAKVEQSAKVDESRAVDEAPKSDVSGKTDEPTTAEEAAAAEEAAIVEKVAAVRAECMTQAREKFGADVLRFRRDGLGHIQLVISRRNGSSLKELYVAKVELKPISTSAVEIEIKEAGLGQRPIMKDRTKFQVKTPNSYSIEIEDPHFGKLPYDAKVGFVAN